MSYLVSMKSVVGGEPWTVLGDFNVLWNPKESSRFDGSQGMARYAGFCDCLNEVEIFDHVFFDPSFTWINNQDDTFQARKLDRVLVNDQWLDSFFSSSVDSLLPGCSDHCCAKMVFINRGTSPPNPFKMFNFWASHPQLMEVVASSWSMPLQGNPMVKLHGMLKSLKLVLKDFNRKLF